MIGSRSLVRDLFLVLSLGGLGCSGSTPAPAVEADADTDADTDADADADTDADADVDDTGALPMVSALTVSVDLDADVDKSTCDEMFLSLTRVTFGGTASLNNETLTYYNYQEEIARQALTGCEATLNTAAITPDKSSLNPISADLGDLSWALYLPAIDKNTGATVALPLSDSPLHNAKDYDQDNPFPGLSNGQSYVGISETVIAYIEGDGSSVADAMGIAAGWWLFRREPGETAFELLKDGDPSVVGITDTELAFEIELNLEVAEDNEITIGGTSSDHIHNDDEDHWYDVGLRPYPWLTQDDVSDSHTDFSFLTEDPKTNKDEFAVDWSLTVRGIPAAEHYIPAEGVESLAAFDQCCQQDITVAIEVPVVYSADHQEGLLFSDEVEGGMCINSSENYMVLLLHYPLPTHLWAAEWYHNLNEKPGWRARYGLESEWWKNLNEDSYFLLNLGSSTSCDITASWTSTTASSDDAAMTSE